MKKQINISFATTITAQQVKRNVLRVRGVTECRTSGPQTVTVTFDETQVQAKLIVKRAGYLRSQRRPARILSVREINPVNQPS